MTVLAFWPVMFLMVILEDAILDGDDQCNVACCYQIRSSDDKWTVRLQYGGKHNQGKSGG